MKGRITFIIVGAIAGFAYCLATFFFVYAISGFAINMGMLLLLPLNAQSVFASDILSDWHEEVFARSNIGVHYYVNLLRFVYGPLANIASGAFFGYLLSFSKRLTVRAHFFIGLLIQFALSLILWLTWLQIHGPIVIGG